MVFEFEIHLDSFMTSCQQKQFNLRPHLKAQGQVLVTQLFQFFTLYAHHMDLVIWLGIRDTVFLDGIPRYDALFYKISF